MVNGDEMVYSFTVVHVGEMVHPLVPEAEVKYMKNMKMM
jgi:hypothetical protein